MGCPVTPELYVDDLGRSLDFYARFGFRLLYTCPAERFAMIGREEARLMLEEPTGRTFLTGPLGSERGRGVNLQIEVSDAAPLWASIPPDARVILPLEECAYAVLSGDVRVRQFVVADPDGYVLRFSERLA